MELTSPDLSLMLWTIVGLLAVVLPAIALFFLLTAKTRSYKQDFLWLLAILFMPFIGSIAYLIYRRKQKLSDTPVTIR